MKLTKKLAIASAGVVVGLAGVSLPSSAQAAQLFNFNYSFTGIGGSTASASGTLTTTDLNAGNNSYTITGITGTRTSNGVTNNILSLLAPGTFGNNDNLLFANAPFLDPQGFAFTAGGANIRVFRVGGLYRELPTFTTSVSNFNVTNVTPQLVPEPATIAATIAAGAGLITARLKQRQKRKVA
ncbi:PEP-CTERM sorting domain-containing protein [Fortiea contorta]|uniref:PEP-CTERM sorting domain-containing protein n=1 Tax=Fortiea contorta TaxID=1892405 RepID=UPI00034ACC05|nr:PEP-CTERM sorting domain-containing protein [Fortiea contorta]